MIPATLCLLAHVNACLLQKLARPARHIGRGRRIPVQIVSVLREAVIIEQQSRSLADVHRELRLGPVRRNEQDRFRSLGKAAEQISQIILHSAPHRRTTAIVIEEEAGPAAMRNIESGLGHAL